MKKIKGKKNKPIIGSGISSFLLTNKRTSHSFHFSNIGNYSKEGDNLYETFN